MRPHEGQRRPRGRWRLTGRILMAILVSWLVAEKMVGILAPTPTVGFWRTLEGERAYAQAYAEVIDTLPVPDDVLDVTTDYGTIRALRWACTNPGPPLVLLAGHSSGAPMWAENLPDWIGTRTVIALDPLGDAGMSSQRVPLTNFEDQAEWISQTLNGLGVEQAHIVGHSFGGANAAILAVRHPALVATLTLLEPVIVVEQLPASALFWATLTQLPVPQDLKDRALAEIGGVSVEEVRERTPMSSLIDAASAHYSTALPLPRTLTDQEWQELDMPVRVDLAGTKSLAGGASAADRLHRLLPNATITLWPQATHSLPMQERETLGPQLMDFWQSHD